MVRLTGVNPLAYRGVEPLSPVNFTIQTRPPTTQDNKDVYIGNIWLDSGTHDPPSNNDLYMLVSLAKGIATWVRIGGGNVETLTGNTGGAVGPDGAENINVLGVIAQGITVTGTPGTNTLSITTVNGENLLQSLTGDIGGAVYPDVNQNIDLLGTAGSITVTGTPVTNTLTLDVDDAVATSYVTDAGTAIPAISVLNVLGSSVINTSAIPVLGNNLYVNLTNGTDGQVLIGGGAAATWASITSTTITITPGPNTLALEYIPPPAQSAFSAYVSATQVNVTGDTFLYKIISDVELFDVNGDYDHTTGEFTAPYDGTYVFEGAVSVIVAVGGGVQGNCLIRNLTTGVEFGGDNYPTRNQVANFTGVNGAITFFGEVFFPLLTGQKVAFHVRTNLGARLDDVEGGITPFRTYFSGFLVYKT